MTIEEKVDTHKRPNLSKVPIVLGFIVLSLVWGSVLLISGIDKLISTTHSLKSLQLLDPLSKDSLTNSKNLISFEETRNSSFTPEFKSIQWISELDSFTNDKGTFVTQDDDLYLIKSIEDESYERVLYNGSNISYNGIDYSITNFVASPNLQYALIQTNWTQHFRHSSFGLYWILDVEEQSIKPLTHNSLSIAIWSPTSDHIAYVLDNDVYIYDLQTAESIRASFDGSASIFNGIPDWVYEEEVFEGDSAIWWSPKGDFVSFLRTNDSLVPEFPITYFAQDDTAYPELRKIKYPKPGYENPNVQLAVYNLESETTKFIGYSYDIFTEVMWVGDDQLLLKSINRESDFLKVVLINANDLSFKIIRDEVTDSWFEITHDTMFIPKSDTREFDGYIDTISVDGFNHLAYFSPPDNPTPKLLTKGQWEVVAAPSAFDHVKNLVYFFSTEVSSIERHLYSVHLTSGDKKRYTDGEGWFSASFSTGARFVSLSYKGPGIPSQKIIDLYTGEAKVLETNTKLHELLNDYDLPTLQYGEVDIGTAVVNYVERLPPHFDEKRNYPVLFFVYGGPGSQLVTKTFEFSFPEVVASQLDAIVVTVDGRGTGFKGRQFRSVVRDNLGYYEVLDQIAAAKHWSSKPYVDSSKIAMFGWSYGGYMTLKTLEADAGETFNYGMSVAPVTDWRLYDSVYTERYMHTPENNPDGYSNASVSNVTQIGQCTRFLLCHGTGDDNVHFQQSAKLLDKFDLAGVENYDLHFFPDSDHAIRYHNANVIIYNKLLRWLERAFSGAYIALK